MKNNKLKEFVELKAKHYFSEERQKINEWRINKMLTNGEHQMLINSTEKNEKLFCDLLYKILK